ncbi:MAG: ECF transporter S component [Brevefilum sp.]|nr:ECF transporter S component [Brevefilum sp.]
MIRYRLLGLLTDAFVFALGFFSLISPFILPQAMSLSSQTAAFPIMVSLIIMLCLLIMVFEAQSSLLDSKMIAFLAVLTAINAGLRFLENAIPGPGGFSPTFFLIILAGYFFGSRIGFLIGAMTLFVSGLITGGIGPWLPGQMITAGWVGQSAVLVSLLVKQLEWKDKPGEIILLAVFGALWGLFYGLIMNLWFWPFLGVGIGQTFTQTATALENFQRYLVYYLTTSLIWDTTRTIGNVLMITFMAKPVLKIFGRFQQRFSFFTQEDRVQP